MTRAFLSGPASPVVQRQPVLLAMGLCSLLGACAASAAPPAVPGGPIHTLTVGQYTCEMPGDAGGPVGERKPEYDFSVVRGSSYKAKGVRGSYLYTGDHILMTGGLLKGVRFHRISDNYLRLTNPDGSDGTMRCVLSSRNP